MAFADDMRKVAQDLCKQFGNSCTLKKEADGVYDPDIGETVPGGASIVVNTYAASESKMSQFFANFGTNTNLSGLYDESIIVPWFGYELDTTWKYNDQHITSVSSTETQGKVVVYNISVGDKE